MKQPVRLSGSHRRPLPGARIVSDEDPSECIEITVQIRRRPGINIKKMIDDIVCESLADRRYLSPAVFAAVAGGDPADIAAVRDFAGERRLQVVEDSIPKRTVRLAGTIADMNTAFDVTLQRYQAGGISYRGREGSITIPAVMEGVIERVLGLDNRPIAVPRCALPASTSDAFNTRSSADYTALRLSKLYQFPRGLDGSGETIALVELNDTDRHGEPVSTGYAVSDLIAYFRALDIRRPRVQAVGVCGGANTPGGVNSIGDCEVTLDVEVAGAVAPGAQIVVYFAPSTDAGLLQALSAAIHDDLRRPSIVSVSWGRPEDAVLPQFRKGMKQALEDAALLGITVCVTSGDNGSSDVSWRLHNQRTHVDFPGSSELALGCGGTTLFARNRREVVWNRGPAGGATGGGVSRVIGKPFYQRSVRVPHRAGGRAGRGVPDVSGHADRYRIFFKGRWVHVGGTSAVAPLWAGLLARINQDLRRRGSNRVGFVNPLLYHPAVRGALHDVRSGDNDKYDDLHGRFKARKGWDPCTGLGAPNGTKLLAALRRQPRTVCPRG